MKKNIIVFLIALCLTGPGFSITTNLTKVIENAIEQTKHHVTYDGSYYRISYPNGDVPDDIGVCTDVIIRAYRAIGVDLQKLVHEDMLIAKDIYDKRRYSKIIDSNIDHRRVPNLRTFLTRQNSKVPISSKGKDYEPGDIVFWDVAAGHVGLVVNIKVSGTDRYKVVHNIGSGPQLEDFLFNATIVDHYRWNTF